jgi:hypothetical protein
VAEKLLPGHHLVAPCPKGGSDESSYLTGQWISPNGGIVIC